MPSPLELWRDRLSHELRGRPPESTDWAGPDGVPTPAAAFADQLDGLPHMRVRSLLQNPGYATRALVTDADPDRAAQRARRAFEFGADEVEFVFDALSQDARDPVPEPDSDPGHVSAELGGWSAPGQGGVAVSTRDHFDRLLNVCDLRAHTLSFAAGDGSLAPLLWTVDHARSKGVDPAELRCGFDFDPIARLTMRRVSASEDQSSVFCPHTTADSVFAEFAAMLHWTGDVAPKLKSLVFDGQTAHLVGGTPAMEIATLLASFLETCRRLEPLGLTADRIASAASLRMQVDQEVLTQTAKLRALRLLWAKVGALVGLSDEQLCPHLVGLTSARSRAERFDQRANLVRSSLATTAAVLGGCDVVVAMPFVDSESELGFELALAQHNLLRHESHLDQIADPTGGSFTVETLTDRVGRAAWTMLQAIEKRGGLLAVIQEGWLNETLSAQESQRESAIDHGRRVLVGINRFADDELGGPFEQIDQGSPQTDGQSDEDVAFAARLAAFQQFRTSRGDLTIEDLSGDATADRLEALSKDERLHRMTLGEISTLYWPAAEERFTHRFLPVAVADGARFEDLREASLDSEPRPRALCLRFGSDPKLRAVCERGADLMTMVGIQIVETAAVADVETVARSVAQLRPDIVLLAGEPVELGRLCDALDQVRHDPRALRIVLGEVPPALAKRLDAPIREGDQLVEVLGSVLHALGVVLESDDE